MSVRYWHPEVKVMGALRMSVYLKIEAEDSAARVF